MLLGSIESSLIAKRSSFIVFALDPREFLLVIFLYAFHGDCDRRCHSTRTRPYHSYGIRVIVHSGSNSSTKGNRRCSLSVPCDCGLNYRSTVIGDLDFFPPQLHRYPEQCFVHCCSD